MPNETGSNDGMSGMAVAIVAIFVMVAVFFIVFWLLNSQSMPTAEQVSQPSTSIEITPPEISPPGTTQPSSSPSPESPGTQY